MALKLSKEPDLWFNDRKVRINLYFTPLKGKEEKLVGVATLNLSENVRGPDSPDPSFQSTREIKFEKCPDKLCKLILDVKSKLRRKSKKGYLNTTTEIFLGTPNDDDCESMMGDDLNDSFISTTSFMSDAETVKQFSTEPALASNEKSQ
jgi:hypothetical protein